MKDTITKILRSIKHFLVDMRIRVSTRRSPLKVMIGAANVSQPGWVRTDIGHLNILCKGDWAHYFPEASIDALMAEHVLEHLTRDEASLAARNFYTFLKAGGRLRVAVPDGNFPDRDYIDYVKPMGHGLGSDDHKILYTHRTLSDLFASIGFTVELLEYWDEDGRFHYTPWKVEDGLIRRSRWNDQRNSKDDIKYTSIILDAIKP